MKRQSHWDNIYATKDTKGVSWFREHLAPSLELIESAQLNRDAHIIDIGGGASTLVDDLLDLGFTNLTVLDISANALEKIKQRLGEKAAGITWTAADITQVALPENEYDVWHDRAVFHFLTEANDRAAYLKNLNRALKPDGHFIIATFADDGPQKCSGLDVERYNIEKLRRTVGQGFNLIQTFREQHRTPSDTTQNFIYAHFRRALQS
jgi:ubiquinone/menaquinone biosynthesis C-methylase UbiE